MRIRPLALVLALSCFPAVRAAAQSNWVDFSDETAARLQISTVPLSDDQEKDMVAADFDRDGDPDVAVVRKLPWSHAGARVDVLLMNENGILVDRTASLAPGFLATDDTRDILAFDADGDGWTDLVTASTFGEQPRLFMNQGLGGGGAWSGFSERGGWFAPVFSPGPKFCAVYDGDVDNDGDADLFFSDYNNTLEDRLLINNGSGFFTDETATRFPTGINASVFGTGSFLCDFNLDGWVDILRSSGSFEPLTLLINGGGGIFTQIQSLPSNAVYMVRTADFNRDGRTDMYVVADGQDYLLYNTGTNPDGTITTTQSMVANSSRTANFGGNVHVADLDRDGWPDAGVADVDVDIPGCTRRFAALRNPMPGQMGMSDPNNGLTLAWNNQGTHDFVWLDINGDGFQDVFMGTCTGYRVLMMEPFAVSMPYGQACPGASGSPAIAASGVPVLGSSSFTIGLRGARVGVRPKLLLSRSRTATDNNGCLMLIGLPALRILNGPVTDASGSASVTLGIPNRPGLEGFRAFAQWFIPDPSGAIFGQGQNWAASNGLEIYVSANTL